MEILRFILGILVGAGLIAFALYSLLHIDKDMQEMIDEFHERSNNK